MDCLICRMGVTQFDLARGEKILSKHPEDVTGVICGKCVRTLITVPKDTIRAAYQTALDKGLPDKARILENFLEEDEQLVGETTKPQRGVDRKRAVREVRPSHHQIRPKRATR